MEAVRVFALAVGAVTDPSGHGNARNRHDGAYKVSVSTTGYPDVLPVLQAKVKASPAPYTVLRVMVGV